MLWEFAHLCFENAEVPEEHPQLMDHLYPELVLRGLSEMVSKATACFLRFALR
jgi:hypothetical protein